MHFFKVPKLGSYLAVELQYQSCQFENAFETAYKEYLQYKERKQDQIIEIEEWKKEQDELKQQKEDDGDQYEPEEKEWEVIEEPEYPTEIKRFVVCIDTMGQDRPLTPEQIDFALQTVKSYSENWTALEKKNLKKDILQREQMHNEEKILIDPEDAPSN